MAKNISKLSFVAAVKPLVLLIAGCRKSNEYEVIERSQRDVPNFQAVGTHTEVEYVLLNDGHKFYSTCDTADIDKLDPTATCAFRPLLIYQCRLGQQPGDKALSDLLCKDGDGHNVYLYVRKKE
jgi:hypothetical protein